MTRFTIATLAALASSVAILPAPASAQFEDFSVQAFRAADADGDERLTLAEFRVLIQQLAAAGAPMSARIRNLGVYRIAFGRVDSNGDGLASPEELYAAERRG